MQRSLVDSYCSFHPVSETKKSGLIHLPPIITHSHSHAMNKKLGISAVTLATYLLQMNKLYVAIYIIEPRGLFIVYTMTLHRNTETHKNGAEPWATTKKQEKTD